MYSYADVLESYTIAEEGINMNTRKSIHTSKEYTDLINAMKAAKSAEKEAKRDKKNIKKWENALNEYNKIPQLVNALKNRIDQEPELDGIWQKICSALTPIFEWKFPEDEVNNFLYIPMGNSTYINYQTTTYHDDLSEKTNSSVKKSYQLRMNLFLKNTKSKISYIKNKINKLR